jgi:hypothetical protein
MRDLRSAADAIHINDTLWPRGVGTEADGIYSRCEISTLSSNSFTKGANALAVIQHHNIEGLEQAQKAMIRVHLRYPEFIDQAYGLSAPGPPVSEGTQPEQVCRISAYC